MIRYLVSPQSCKTAISKVNVMKKSGPVSQHPRAMRSLDHYPVFLQVEYDTDISRPTNSVHRPPWTKTQLDGYAEIAQHREKLLEHRSKHACDGDRVRRTPGPKAKRKPTLQTWRDRPDVLTNYADSGRGRKEPK